MRLPFDTLLFDLDGTLSDSKEGIVNSVLYALDKLSIREEHPEKLNAFVGPPMRESLHRYYGMEGEELERAIEIYREYFVPKGMYENVVYPGIREALARLKQAGIRLIVCTAKAEVYAEEVLRYFGMRDLFDYVKGASLDSSLARKADIIQRVFQDGQVVGSCAMVGDRMDDLQGAKENGIQAFGVRWGYAVPGELEGCQPAAIFSNVEEMTRFFLGQRGLFITFEGQDGAGKSTQIIRLKAFLEEQGFAVAVTREPGGCSIAEKIRGILLDPENGEMDPVCEAYLYAAARAQHLREVIIPALLRGEIVLCDRFYDSSLAYQGAGRGLGTEQVAQINAQALGGWMPDLTLYFSMDPESGIGRNVAAGRRQDRMEIAGADFRTRVREGFMALAEKEPDRIFTVDAAQPIEKVWQEVLFAVREYLHLKL